MANTAPIVIPVTAEFEGMIKEMDKAEKKAATGASKIGSSFKKIGTSVKNTMKNLRTFAIVGVGAMGAAAYAVSKITNRMDELAKSTRTIGFPIEEFQEWNFVAEQSGLSTQMFTDSLGIFTKRLGEAKTGTGELYSSLKDTNAELLNQMMKTDDVSEAFEMYIKAMQDVKGDAELAAMANDAFGRSGMKMGLISRNTAGEIAALRKEMIENGIVTEEQAKKAEEYNDAMNSLEKTLGNLTVDTLTPAIPMFTQLAKSTRQWVNDLKPTNGQIDQIGTAIENVINITKPLGDLLLSAAARAPLPFIEIMRYADKAFNYVVNVGSSAFGLLLTSFVEVGNSMVNSWKVVNLNISRFLVGTIQTMVDSWSSYTSILSKVPGMGDMAQDIWDSGQIASQGLTEMQQSIRTSLGKVEEDLKGSEDAVKEAFSVMKEASENVDLASPLLDGLSSMLSGTSDGAFASFKESLAALFAPPENANEGLITTLAEQNEILAEDAALKLENKSAFLNELSNAEADYYSKLSGMQKTSFENMNGEDRSAMMKTTEVWNKNYQGKMKMTGSFFKTMSGLMQTENRKMFEVGKAAAMAETVVNTAKGAMSAYSAMAGIPYVGPALGIAAAAAVGVAGAAQLNNIRKTSFGSGSSVGATPTGGAVTADTDVGGGAAAGGSGQSQGPSNITNINLQGERFGEQQVRSMLSSLSESSEDGTIIRLN